MQIKVTDRAVQEIKTIMAEQNLPCDTHFLRMGIIGGGCSGFQYKLDIVSEKDEMDEQAEFDEVTVVVDPRSLMYLEGVTLDFKDDLMGRGFTFDNPQATGQCGCGSSFHI